MDLIGEGVDKNGNIVINDDEYDDELTLSDVALPNTAAIARLKRLPKFWIWFSTAKILIELPKKF
ncbi:MAG: hypothetical protein IJR52_09990 [Selenomonadaceae bacterium]|nr:hypothetical protein [Selenomonadaceae bacterium]